MSPWLQKARNIVLCRYDDVALDTPKEEVSTTTASTTTVAENPSVSLPYTLSNEEEKPRAYPLPRKSKSETERLDGQHNIFTSRLNGLYGTNFPNSFSPARVLDVGCGTGIWSRQFAAKHASSQVLGIDISPPAERHVLTSDLPPNCQYLKADFFKDWDFTVPSPNSPTTVRTDSAIAMQFTAQAAAVRPVFDFIYMRMLMAAVSSWPTLLRRAYEHLAPGGRLELFEGLMEMNGSNASSTAATSAAIRWFEMAQHYMAAHGVRWDAALELPQMLRDAGFVDVEDRPLKMGLYRMGDVKEKGVAGPKEEDWVGREYAGDMAGLVDGMGSRLRTDRSSRLSESEWDSLEKEAKRELTEEGEKRGFYTVLHVFLAKKPEDAVVVV